MMDNYLIYIIAGFGLALGGSIYVTARIVLRRITKKKDEEISRISEEFANTKMKYQKSTKILKDVIKAQDECISEQDEYIRNIELNFLE